MNTQTRERVVLITQGIDHGLSSAGMVIALGGMTAGQKVAIFLTGSGVDIVRRVAAETTHVKPLEPLADMLKDFLARGCTQEALIDGVVITGSSVMHEAIKRGAATLCI